jgi:hypothetical protein
LHYQSNLFIFIFLNFFIEKIKKEEEIMMENVVKLIVVLFLCQEVIYGKLLRNVGSSWLKRSSNNEEQTSSGIRRCLTISGGASDNEKNGEKIQGVCIGIDLGTTYRYVMHRHIFSAFMI